MNKEKINNIVILKEVPSNLIEEAIIIFKSNNYQNKKKIEEYVKLEGMDIIKKYIEEEKSKKEDTIKKRILIFGISIFFLLFIIVMHIH